MLNVESQYFKLCYSKIVSVCVCVRVCVCVCVFSPPVPVPHFCVLLLRLSWDDLCSYQDAKIQLQTTFPASSS